VDGNPLQWIGLRLIICPLLNNQSNWCCPRKADLWNYQGFTDLISAGIHTIKDVEVWLLHCYYDVGEDPLCNKNNGGDLDWNFSASPKKKGDTTCMLFGPF
jgi:hypothetical protein